MKNTIIFFAFFTSIIASSFAGTFTSKQNGAWNDPNTWNEPGFPTNNCTITINPGDDVTSPNTLQLSGVLTVNGTLRLGAGELRLNGFSGQILLGNTGTINASNLILDYTNPAIINILDGTINANNFFTVKGSSSVSGSPTITSTTTNITGPTSINFTTGTTITSTTLNANTSSSLNIDGTLNISGDVNIDGDAGLNLVGGTLNTTNIRVTGSSGLTADGTVTATGDISVSGTSTIDGTGKVGFATFTPASPGLGFTCVGRIVETNPTSVFDLTTCGMILPVTYTYFDHSCDDKTLKWQTAQEENNDFFLIEASNDLIHYKPIGQVDGNGNSVIENDYNFSVENEVFNYYRLKQVDYNGDYEPSKIVVNSCYTPNTSNTYIYPTNSNDIFYLSHNFINEDEEVNVTITTLAGQEITTSVFTIDNLTEGINLTTFNNGTYIATIRTTSFVKSEKIIKF